MLLLQARRLPQSLLTHAVPRSAPGPNPARRWYPEWCKIWDGWGMPTGYLIPTSRTRAAKAAAAAEARRMEAMA